MGSDRRGVPEYRDSPPILLFFAGALCPLTYLSCCDQSELPLTISDHRTQCVPTMCTGTGTATAAYSRSTIVAFAMPPPSHMVCRP